MWDSSHTHTQHTINQIGASQPKRQFFFITQKIKRKKYIIHTYTHTHTHTHTKKKRRRSSQQKKKKPATVVGLWVYVGIEHCTFDLEFSSLFGWLEVEGKEKKEEPLLPTRCDFSFGLLAIDKDGAQSVEKFFSYMTVFFYYYFFIEILVKLGFQNKNKGSLGIMLKMTRDNVENDQR